MGDGVKRAMPRKHSTQYLAHFRHVRSLLGPVYATHLRPISTPRSVGVTYTPPSDVCRQGVLPTGMGQAEVDDSGYPQRSHTKDLSEPTQRTTDYVDLSASRPIGTTVVPETAPDRPVSESRAVVKGPSSTTTALPPFFSVCHDSVLTVKRESVLCLRKAFKGVSASISVVTPAQESSPLGLVYT